MYTFINKCSEVVLPRPRDNNLADDGYHQHHYQSQQLQEQQQQPQYKITPGKIKSKSLEQMIDESLDNEKNSDSNSLDYDQLKPTKVHRKSGASTVIKQNSPADLYKTFGTQSLRYGGNFTAMAAAAATKKSSGGAQGEEQEEGEGEGEEQQEKEQENQAETSNDGQAASTGKTETQNNETGPSLPPFFAAHLRRPLTNLQHKLVVRCR